MTVDGYRAKLSSEGFALREWDGRIGLDDVRFYELTHPDGRASHGYITYQALDIVRDHPTAREALWLSHLKSARKSAQHRT